MLVAHRTGVTRDEIARQLEETRERTLLLVSGLSESDLRAQHDRLMSPVVWDLAHIAHFEELWLTRNLTGPVEFAEMPGMFDPFENPRAVRGALDLPTIADTLATMTRIRAEVLHILERVDLDSDAPLLAGGFVYAMVVQHESQHLETILQTLQLKTGSAYHPPVRRQLPVGRLTAAPAAMVRCPGGRIPVGTDDSTQAYDNERPRHAVSVAPFWIDATPVTNGQFLRFMEAGGYDRRELWTEAGWAWRRESGVTAPAYWLRRGEKWAVRTMDEIVDVDPDRPVCHVSYHEADAFSRFAGKRLPSEAEWEVAASWDPATGEQRRFPWGDAEPTALQANIDQLGFGTAPVGAYADNVSPIGCYGMIGDVWEWTSTDFNGYPGFVAFPYREYSEVFFGSGYKVLRGGSWATCPAAIRATFRNWDYPIRRQIFSGFRCARDD